MAHTPFWAASICSYSWRDIPYLCFIHDHLKFSSLELGHDRRCFLNLAVLLFFDSISLFFLANATALFLYFSGSDQ